MTEPAGANPVLHHVTFKTHRMREMVEWYGMVLGMKVIFEYHGGAWLTNDGANHRLALLVDRGWPDDPRKLQHTGLHHSAYEFASIGDLLSAYQRLLQCGLAPHACLDHGMTLSFYYADPDGNSVELQCDVYSDWSKSTNFMLHSREFAENPIGVSVDPDRLVEAYEHGESRETLHQRAYAGDFPASEPLNLRLPAPSAEPPS